MTIDAGQKVIAIVLSLGTIGGATMGVWLGARGKADAAEVSAIRSDVTALKVTSENEIEWRRWLAEQLGQISIRVGAPTSPPPAMSVNPHGR